MRAYQTFPPASILSFAIVLLFFLSVFIYTARLFGLEFPSFASDTKPGIFPCYKVHFSFHCRSTSKSYDFARPRSGDDTEDFFDLSPQIFSFRGVHHRIPPNFLLGEGDAAYALTSPPPFHPRPSAFSSFAALASSFPSRSLFERPSKIGSRYDACPSFG